MNPQSHEEWHAQAVAARDAYVKSLRDCGQLGPETRFPCLLAPGDFVAVHRQGPKDTASTYVSLTTVQHGEPAVIALTPQSARRLAATLLDVADEIDPFKGAKGVKADKGEQA